MVMPGLKKIKHIATGSNHVMCLDHKGAVYGFGAGQQNQLGRRVVERTRTGALTPREFGLPKNKIIYVSCGSEHCFAIDNKDQVWAWGSNNYGQTGISDGAGGDRSIVLVPTVIKSLRDYKVKEIASGMHHSLACDQDGKLLIWGRIDSAQGGIPLDEIPKENIMSDDRGNPRILTTPTQIPGTLQSPFPSFFPPNERTNIMN